MQEGNSYADTLFHQPYGEYDDDFEHMEILRAHLPSNLIPKDPEDRAKLALDIARLNTSRMENNKRKQEEDDLRSTQRVKSEFSPVCGDTREHSSEVSRGLFQLSKFHLGVGGDDESEIEPAQFGMNDLSFKVDKWDEQPFAKHTGTLESYPLRQDGTDKKKEDQNTYGEAWKAEWFARQKVKEEDVWYQLLVEIAGGTNTTVDRLQTPQNIEAREITWRIHAEKQSQAIRTKFDLYKQAIKDIAIKEKEIADKKEELPSSREFELTILQSSDMLVKMSGGKASLAEYIWKGRYFYLYSKILEPLLENDSALLIGDTGKHKIDNLEVEKKLRTKDSKALYGFMVVELLSMIWEPTTTIKGLLSIGEKDPAFSEEDKKRIGENATERDSLGGNVFASDYAYDNSPPKSGSALAQVQKNAKFILDGDRSNILDWALMFLVAYYIVDRGPKLPTSSGISEDVLNKFQKVVSTLPGKDLKQKIVSKYSSAVSRNVSIFKKNTIQQDVELQTDKYRNFVSFEVTRLKDNMVKSWTFLGLKDDINKLADKAKGGSTAFLKSNPAVQIAQIHMTSDPMEILALSDGEVYTDLQLFASIVSTTSEAGTKKTIARLTDELIDLKREAQTLSDEASSGGGTMKTPPYVPDPQWVLRTEFTGRMSMQPIVRNAITQSYFTVKKHAPAIIYGMTDDAGLEKLVSDNELRHYFVEIIVMMMHRTRQRFQVRWLPGSNGASIRSVKVALDGLRALGGGARGRGPLRSPYPSEIFSISKMLPRGLV